VNYGSKDNEGNVMDEMSSWSSMFGDYFSAVKIWNANNEPLALLS